MKTNKDRQRNPPNPSKVKGWKVITKNTRKSTCNDPKFSLHYPKNKRVVPKIPNSKLFFFKTRQAARNFKSIYLWKIVPCIAENTSPAFPVAHCTNDFYSFWKKPSSYFILKSPPPNGTLFADAITCIE